MSAVAFSAGRRNNPAAMKRIAVLWLIVAASLCGAEPVVPWEKARDVIGQRATVEGMVVATVGAKAIDSRDGQEHASGRSMNYILEAIRKIHAHSAALAKGT